jgi:hypothetical protein
MADLWHARYCPASNLNVWRESFLELVGRAIREIICSLKAFGWCAHHTKTALEG